MIFFCPVCIKCSAATQPSCIYCYLVYWRNNLNTALMRSSAPPCGRCAHPQSAAMHFWTSCRFAFWFGAEIWGDQKHFVLVNLISITGSTYSFYSDSGKILSRHERVYLTFELWAQCVCIFWSSINVMNSLTMCVCGSFPFIICMWSQTQNIHIMCTSCLYS